MSGANEGAFYFLTGHMRDSMLLDALQNCLMHILWTGPGQCIQSQKLYFNT